LCIFVYRQQNLTLRYGARSTGDTSCKNDLYDQLMHLIDIILDGQKCYLESIRGTEKFDILFQQYETERHAIIEPFCKCVAVHTCPLLCVVMIYLLTAIGLPPGGSSTVHVYTQTIHRMTQNAPSL